MGSRLRTFLVVVAALGAGLAFTLATPSRAKLEAAFADGIRPRVAPGRPVLVVFGDPKT